MHIRLFNSMHFWSCPVACYEIKLNKHTVQHSISLIAILQVKLPVHIAACLSIKESCKDTLEINMEMCKLLTAVFVVQLSRMMKD